MISKILRAKNWQVFLIIFGSLFCIQFFLIRSIFATNEAAAIGPVSFDMYFIYVPLAILFSMFTIGAWFWSIGLGLQKIIPHELQLNKKSFKISLAIPAVYSLFLVWIFVQTTSVMLAASSGDAQTSLELEWSSFIIPLHLVAICSVFYSMGFVARTIKIAELRRSVQFSDYVGIFFSIWFLPIGIWSLQAKVNHLVATHTTKFEQKKGNSFLLDDELF